MKKTLVLTLLIPTAIGLFLSLNRSDAKINPKNIQIDIKGVYLENPNEKVCLPALLADAKRNVSASFDENFGQIFKHDPKCETGVFLEDKDGVYRCTFCNRVED